MSDTLRAELWAVLDREPQSDRDLVETVRNLRAFRDERHRIVLRSLDEARAALARRDTTIAAAAVAWRQLEADGWMQGDPIPADLQSALDQLAALSAPVEAGTPAAEPAPGRDAQTAEPPRLVAELDGKGGCPEKVWDGPYRMRCSLGRDVCGRHGRFAVRPAGPADDTTREAQ